MRTAKPVRILYMEDDPGLAKLFRKEMGRAGFEVDVAHDGAQGLEIFDPGAHSILAVDHAMPIKTGLEVIEELAARGEIPPIIMITGAGSEKVAVEAMKLGAMDYVIKDPEARYLQLLPSILDQALERRRELEAKKDAEQALMESESRYRALFESAADSIFVLDTSGGILDSNQVSREILGYSKQTMSAMNFEEICSYNKPGVRLMDKLLELASQGEGFIEVSQIRSDRSETPVELSARTIDYSGRAAILIIARDVTERLLARQTLQNAHDELEQRVAKRTRELGRANKLLETEIAERSRAEQSLFEQNRFLQSILESLTHPFHVIDVENYKVVIANSASRAAGYNEGETCHRAIHGLDRPCQDPDRSCPVRMIKETKAPISLEMARNEASGKVIHENLQAYPLFDDNFDVKKIIEYRIDISDVKRAQQERKAYEERFEVIFKSARECMFVKDRQGRYLLVNPAMESLFEAPASKIMSLTDEGLFGADEAQHIREIETRVLKGEIVEEEHTRKVRGNSVTFLDTRAPIHDSEGNVIGICGIARNITDRKLTRNEPISTEFHYPSETMRSTMAQTSLAAQSDSLVLLTGESGVGKDYLSKYIHNKSARSKGPFFSINCAAVPARLAEAELFGHEKGAFTGALNRSRGLLELAEGGTLLLNEIGELSPEMQAKLLTFLDTRTFTRVGGRELVSVSARIIAATNRDLLTDVKAGRFRSDLYFRLNVISIHIPPLRERREDIPILAREILASLTTELQLVESPGIDEAGMAKLTDYDWPGNIRELRNVLERGLILSDKGEIRLDSLEPDSPGAAAAAEIGLPPGKSLNETLKDLKLRMINQAMEKAGGNKQKAAGILGISRYALARTLNSSME
jgi:PAS domain S-box-containing protein